MQHDANGGPDVIAFPPLIFLAGLGISLLAKLKFGLPIAPKWLAGPRRKSGVLLIGAGLGVGIWSLRSFQAAGTSVDVREPSSALVETGPYQYTRNPIYVGMTAVYTGITLLLNNLWGLLLLPVVLRVMEQGVIEREEAYLRARFGDAYEAFTERIPRWL